MKNSKHGDLPRLERAVILAVRVPKQIRQQYQDEADREGVKLSTMVRIALYAFLEPRSRK